MIYIYVLLAIGILICFIQLFILPIYKRNKIKNQLFKSIENKSYTLKQIHHESYDFTLESDKMILLIKCIMISPNSMITINSQETWDLSYGGLDKSKGKSFPHHKYLNELIPFLKKNFQTEKQNRKVILIYPSTTQIVRYLNESELEEIHVSDLPYGYKVIQFASWDEEMEQLFLLK